MIVDQETWNTAAIRLSGERELALDTESNSFYTYRESICLIQIGSSEENLLLDPLEVKDLSSLGEMMADPAVAKVLHGSDYDLRSFDRDYGFRVRGLFDTEIAAVFLGESRPNLGTVLENFLEVSIPKSAKLQRSNWGLRPLSSEAREYALHDVAHLSRLAQELRRRLQDARRLEWVREECQRLENVRYSPPDPPEVAFRRIKGSNKLDPRQLAVLKELHLFRDEEAQSQNSPPFRVIRNETLLTLAQSPSMPLERVPGLSPQLVQRRGASILSAIERGREGPEIPPPARPDRANSWTPEARRRSQLLKQWRGELGEDLGLDPPLLWPTASLERLAVEPRDWQSELMGEGPPEVRHWQRQEFAAGLEEFLASSILA